ncbi:Tn3 family transposase [Streptomyces brevispora]|uniref:Tn3 family transposase n=1 Tax=Streptomyces brevispora TaxID=887462 RepID=UPI0035DE40B8
MEVDRQYTDTHGASIVAVAFAHVLGFTLVPGLKNIGSAKLYRPVAGQDGKWPDLALVLSTDANDWDLTVRPYDQIVKYTTAPRPGTSGAGQVLRRFILGGPKHPPLTRRSENVGGRCVPSSCATASPVWRCGARSTRGRRSWRSWNSAGKDLFYGKRRPGRGGQGVPGGVHARAPPARARPWSTSTRC